MGALVGLYATEMLSHFALTLCFEPLPEAYAVLCENLKAKAPSGKWQAFNRALGENAGTLNLSYPVCAGVPIKQWASTTKNFEELQKTYPGRIDAIVSTQCAVERLDDALANIPHPPIGFMKIDAEGAEESILRGASKTLETDRPVLAIELEERHVPGCTQRVPVFLKALGYEMFFMLGGDVLPITEFDPARWQKGPPVPAQAMPEVPFSQPYIQMFLALPANNRELLESIRTFTAARFHALWG